MDLQLTVEVMFCVAHTAKSGRRVTAGEVAKRCGGVITYHVAKKILRYLHEIGITNQHTYLHRAASGKRGDVWATHYTMKTDLKVQLFYQGCAGLWEDLEPMYEVVRAGAK